MLYLAPSLPLATDHALLPSPFLGATSGQLVATAPLATCEVCVVVPVRDEAATLDDTLRALACQVDDKGRPLVHERYEIVLLANNCRDESAMVARRFAHAHRGLALHVVERTLPAEANVGHARRLLMDEAYRRLTVVGRPRGVIASTDGDTVVAPTWIAATLDEIARGADVVGGRIVVDNVGHMGMGMGAAYDRGVRRYHLRDVAYRLLVAAYEARLDPDPHDPWPRHHQHFGASLAVTIETYQRAGGLPNVPMLEDMALIQVLRRLDARIRHSPSVQVVTSGRRDARARIGLATQLGEWAAMDRAGQPWLVESVSSLEQKLCARRALRQLWNVTQTGARPRERDVDALGNMLGLDRRWLSGVIARPTSYGVLIDAVERRQAEEGLWTLDVVEITEAIADLRRRLGDPHYPMGRITEAVVRGSSLE